MNILTVDMIHKLNKTLTEVGVGFVYTYHEDNTGPYAKIEIKDNGQGWIYDLTISLTDKYLNWLRSWFWDTYKINIEFINTGNIFWAMH